MKHYIRLIASVFLLIIAAILFPIGIVSKAISKLFETYLSWLVTSVERWIDELENLE